MKMSIWRVQDRKYHYADDDDDEMIHIAPLRKSSIIRRLDWKYKVALYKLKDDSLINLKNKAGL